MRRSVLSTARFCVSRSFDIYRNRIAKQFAVRCLSTRKMHHVQMDTSEVRPGDLRMAALLEGGVDKSLELEAVHLKSCEDVVLKRNAYKWCSNYLGGSWSKIPFEALNVQYISGGLTNYLYLCSLPDDIEYVQDEKKQVLLRIYGEIMDNKAKFYEGVIFTLLSERGFGPHLYGVFSSGRIEQYIPARHLNTDELTNPWLSSCIAKKLGKYHSMQLPLNREPSWLWSNMDTWLSVTNVANFSDAKNKELMSRIKALNLDEEYSNLRSYLMKANSKVVFCHNDFQERNILLVKENEQDDVFIIDYEYSSYNYRGFDIGNHFCEFMFDYGNEEAPGFFWDVNAYPNKEQQRHFAKHYLKRHNELVNGVSEEPSETEIDTLLIEANKFALASHLFWGFWSVVQAGVSKIDFGFLEYALARFDTYSMQKPLFWKEEK